MKIEQIQEFQDSKTEAVSALHFTDSGEIQKIETSFNEQAVTFSVDGFSVYGIVGTETIKAEFTASDHRTYEVTVTYGTDAGVPANAALVVNEVSKDSEKYDEYVELTAKAVKLDLEELNYIKLFDIGIVDENGDKVTIQSPVEVAFRLLDKEEGVYTQVVHFTGINTTEVISPSVDENVVCFPASSFSIYAIIGTETEDPSDTQSVKFEFYCGAPTNVEEYVFVNQNAETTNVQYVTGSEYLQNPGLPAYNGADSSVAQAFLGWCYAIVDDDGSAAVPTDANGEPVSYDFRKTLAANLAEFDSVSSIDLSSLEADEYGNYTIQLLAVYNKAVYVYYYSEGSEKSGNDGYDIHAISLIGEDGTEDFSATEYVPDSSSEAFLGWSTYTPSQQAEELGEDTYRKYVLDHENNLYGETILSLTQEDDGSIAVYGGTDTKDSIISLYPVVADVFWVTYDKNDWVYTYDTKDGAYDVSSTVENPGAGMYSYDSVTETYTYANGSGDWDLTFSYTGAQQGTYSRSGSGATYIAPVYVLEGESLINSDNHGFPVPSPEWDGYTFGGWYTDEALTDAFSEETVISSVYTQYNGGNEEDHSLTLYAKWIPNDTSYTVAIWLENADDEDYSFVTSYTLPGTTKGTTAAGNFVTNGGRYYTKDGDGTLTPAGNYASRTALLQEVFGSEVIRFNNQNHTYYEYTYYDYEHPSYTEATIDGSGSTVVNVFYDRNEYTVRFYYGWGVPSGEYSYIKVATSSGYNESAVWESGYYYESSLTYWRRANNSTYYQLYYNETTGIFYRDRNLKTRHEGDVYIRSSSGDLTYYISTERTDYDAFGSNSNRQTVAKAVLESVKNCGTTTVGENTVYYFDLTTKYGADITDRWPTKILTDDGTEIDTGNYAFISWLTDSGSVYRAVASSNANIKGTFSTMSKTLVTKTDGTATTAANGGVAHIAHGRFDAQYYNYQYYYYFWDPNSTSNDTQYTADDIIGFSSESYYPSGLNAAPVLPDDLLHFDTYLYKDAEKNGSSAYSGDWTTYMVNTRSAGYIQQQALMEVAGYTRVAYTGYLGSGGAGSGTGASNTSHSEGHMYYYFWPNLHELEFRDGGTLLSSTKAYYSEDISDSSDRSTVSDTLSASYMNTTYGSDHPGYEFVGWFADDGLGTYVFFHQPTGAEIGSVLAEMVDREESSRYTEISAAAYEAMTEDEKAAIVITSSDEVTHYYRLNYIVYESMPDSGLTFYAGWRPMKYRVWIQANGGQLSLGSMSTYFNNTYQQLVGKYEGVQRNFVPAVATTLESETRYAYVEIADTAYSGARIALYVYKDGEDYYYFDTAENTAESVGSNPVKLRDSFVEAALATGQLEDDDFKYVYKYHGYALVGWYQYLGPDEVTKTSPPSVLTSDELTQWNFGEGITEHTAIRAVWKRTGYLTVAYRGTGYQLNSDGTITAANSEDAIPDVDVSSYGTTDYSYADHSQGVANMAPEMSSEDARRWIFVGWISPDYKEAVDQEGNVLSGSNMFSYIHDPGSTFTIVADWADVDDGDNNGIDDDHHPNEYHFYYVLYPVFMQIGTSSITYTYTETAAPTMTGTELTDYGVQMVENSNGELVEAKATDNITTENNTISGLKLNSSVRVSDGSGFTRTGYILIGWNDDPEAADAGTVKYALGFVYGVSSNNNTLYAVWTRSTDIKLTKIDTGDNFLQGAEFTLYSDSACNTAVGTAVSDDNGEVLIQVEVTEAGERIYYMKETSSPEGYQDNSEKYTVTVKVTDLNDPSTDVVAISGSGNDCTSLVTGNDASYAVKNKLETIDVTVFKTAQDGITALTKAVFDLAKLSNNEVFVSFGNGTYTVSSEQETLGKFTESLPAGIYKLKETKAPDGYIIPSGEIYFLVEKNASDELTVFLAVKNVDEDGKVTYTATSQEVNNALVNGTVITIKNLPGQPLPRTGGTGTLLYTLLGALMTVTAGAVLILRIKKTTA